VRDAGSKACRARVGCALALLHGFGLVLTPSKSARAAGVGEPEHAASAEPDVTSEVAVGGAYLAAVEDEDLHHHGGIGASYSYYIISRLLSVEVVAHTLFASHLVAFPVDFQLKIDRALTAMVHPYFAAGPTVVGEVVRGEAKVWPGISTALGVDLWNGPRWGFMIELNANLVAVHGLRPELGTFIGPVTRF
jgi:hypothetical protein